jgi:uncharacterized protein (TIGR02594 family)
MPNNDFDDLFDQWGSALNVNPQLAKSVFHAESSGQLNSNPMGITPEVVAKIAPQLGFDPKSVDLSDMRWAVPIATRVLADGLNATQGSAEGAAGYYNSGSADPSKWNPGYVSNVTKLYPNMTLTPPRPAPDGSAIVSTATSQMDQGGGAITPWLRDHGQSLDPTKANWCAAFVNGALEANGVHGTNGAGKNVATSFMNWGTPVQGDPQAGDVLVQPRGHPAGGIGGHVGIFAGQIADGKDGPYYLMTSGNYDNKVAYSWEPASSVVARRAPELSPPPPQSQPQVATQ